MPGRRGRIRDNGVVWRRLRIGTALVFLAAAAGAAQYDRPGGAHRTDLAYDGQVTFVRLAWRSGFGYSRGFGSAWNHDFPRAEQHLALILRELTTLDMRTGGSLILTLDDPELLKYPIAFMWEPGFWNLSRGEADAFRRYLLKGGFAVFEDFDGPAQWSHFEAQMREVLPDHRLVKLDASHGIFDSFFRIADAHTIVHPMIGIRPSYYGIFEDNDPSKRLMVVANFDNDIPEYWEWSGQGLYPFNTSNDAYKLGVNYFVYGLTH